MSWNFGGYYTKRNSLGRLDAAKRQVEVQRDIFLFDNRLDAAEESGEIARLRRALADDDRIVRLRRAVREAAESECATACWIRTDCCGRSPTRMPPLRHAARGEIELLKTIYELKHTINR